LASGSDEAGTVTPLVLTPAEFGAYMTAETAKWAKVIKLANIKAQ
jgi:tripartite-type tricarboxylate transporter receptor subunit TctC